MVTNGTINHSTPPQLSSHPQSERQSPRSWSAGATWPLICLPPTSHPLHCLWKSDVHKCPTEPRLSHLYIHVRTTNYSLLNLVSGGRGFFFFFIIVADKKDQSRWTHVAENPSLTFVLNKRLGQRKLSQRAYVCGVYFPRRSWCVWRRTPSPSRPQARSFHRASCVSHTKKKES